MKIRQWFAPRGAAYVYERAAKLLGRYGLTPAKAVDRVGACVATLAEHGCSPTFPTPGRVVQKYPQFFRQLQDAGAEIAVHGYDHVDLAAYAPAEAGEQLLRAADVFARHGIEAHGFRCPYLSCNSGLLDVLPEGVFEYSSNKAIWWDVVSSAGDRGEGKTPAVLHRLYKPTPAHAAVCVPHMESKLLEIPVCLPDDLELHDALQRSPEGMAQAWSQVLHRTHRAGELFNLVFHPELAWSCQQPFVSVLREAERLQPSVWIARLCDISDWWTEKAGFGIATSFSPEDLHISFSCSERATVLVRGLGAQGTEQAWDGAYRQLLGRTLHVPAEPRPFVGLPINAPRHIISFLRDQGYILDTDETATRCGTYLDAATLAGLRDEVGLIEFIESSSTPLVRYWRWPDGAKSALCVSGDLDALSLPDYAYRLFAR